MIIHKEESKVPWVHLSFKDSTFLACYTVLIIFFSDLFHCFSLLTFLFNFMIFNLKFWKKKCIEESIRISDTNLKIKWKSVETGCPCAVREKNRWQTTNWTPEGGRNTEQTLKLMETKVFTEAQERLLFRKESASLSWREAFLLCLLCH